MENSVVEQRKEKKEKNCFLILESNEISRPGGFLHDQGLSLSTASLVSFDIHDYFFLRKTGYVFPST